MKRCIRKILFCCIIMLLFICIKSYATDSFRVSFQNGMSAKTGDIIKVPLILDKMDFEGVQKGVITFTCEINYDEDVFEFIEFEDNISKFEYIENGETKLGDKWECEYDEQSKKLVFKLLGDFLTNGLDSLNDYSEIANFKFKIKDGLKTGEYYLEVNEIEGGNDETSVSGIGGKSIVNVKGIDEIAKPEQDKVTTNYNKNEDDNSDLNEKPIKIQIKQSKSGKKVYIIPDEENGIKIGKVIVGDEELVRVDGMYTFNSQVGVLYEIKFYGVDGTLLCNKSITTKQTNTEEITTIDTEVKEEKEENIENKENNNEKKSPQTGDYVYIAVAILAVLTSIWTVIFFKKINN